MHMFGINDIKKIFCLFLLSQLTLTTSTVIASGNNERSTNSIELEIWTPGNIKYHEVIHSNLEEKTGFQIHWQQGYENYSYWGKKYSEYSSLVVNLANGTFPDILFQIPEKYVRELSKQEALEPLTNLPDSCLDKNTLSQFADADNIHSVWLRENEFAAIPRGSRHLCEAVTLLLLMIEMMPFDSSMIR